MLSQSANVLLRLAWLQPLCRIDFAGQHIQAHKPLNKEIISKLFLASLSEIGICLMLFGYSLKAMLTEEVEQ